MALDPPQLTLRARRGTGPFLRLEPYRQGARYRRFVASPERTVALRADSAPGAGLGSGDPAWADIASRAAFPRQRFCLLVEPLDQRGSGPERCRFTVPRRGRAGHRDCRWHHTRRPDGLVQAGPYLLQPARAVSLSDAQIGADPSRHVVARIWQRLEDFAHFHRLHAADHAFRVQWSARRRTGADLVGPQPGSEPHPNLDRDRIAQCAARDPGRHPHRDSVRLCAAGRDRADRRPQRASAT